jgi:hypothetical protein
MAMMIEKQSLCLVGTEVDSSHILAFPSFSHINLLNLAGSGWAAHAILKVTDTYRLRLIVVSPTNHFVFTPSK